ncbi:hypothetical protein ACFQ1B_04130 [Streptomyces mexicanus]
MRNPMAALRLRVDALHTHLPAAADRTYTGVTAELDRPEPPLDDMLALAGAEHRAGELAVSDGADARCDAAEVALTQHQGGSRSPGGPEPASPPRPAHPSRPPVRTTNSPGSRTSCGTTP